MESRMREIRTYGLTRGKSHRRQPRRGSLLYKKIGLALACAAVAVVAYGVEFALGVGAYEGRAAFKDLRIVDADAKVVYSNDFATPDAVKDWLSAGRGVWKCGGGTLEQTFGGLGHEAVSRRSSATSPSR